MWLKDIRLSFEGFKKIIWVVIQLAWLIFIVEIFYVLEVKQLFKKHAVGSIVPKECQI